MANLRVSRATSDSIKLLNWGPNRKKHYRALGIWPLGITVIQNDTRTCITTYYSSTHHHLWNIKQHFKTFLLSATWFNNGISMIARGAIIIVQCSNDILHCIKVSLAGQPVFGRAWNNSLVTLIDFLWLL